MNVTPFPHIFNLWHASTPSPSPPPHFSVATIIQIDRTVIIHIPLRGPTSLSKTHPKLVNTFSRSLLPDILSLRHTRELAWAVLHTGVWKHLQDFPGVLSQMCLHPTLTPTPTPVKHSALCGCMNPIFCFLYSDAFTAWALLALLALRGLPLSGLANSRARKQLTAVCLSYANLPVRSPHPPPSLWSSYTIPIPSNADN